MPPITSASGFEGISAKKYYLNVNEVTKEQTEHRNEGQANCFCQGPTSSNFRLCRAFRLCCIYSTWSTQYESSHRQYINKWVWQISIKFYLQNQIAGYVWLTGYNLSIPELNNALIQTTQEIFRKISGSLNREMMEEQTHFSKDGHTKKKDGHNKFKKRKINKL